MFQLSATAGRLLPRLTARCVSSSTTTSASTSTHFLSTLCRLRASTHASATTSLRTFHQTSRLLQRGPSKPSPKKPDSATTPATTDAPLRLLDRLKTAGQLSSEAEPPMLTVSQRLFRPLLFTLLVVGGSVAYASTWTAPTASERWFPTVPISFATVASIMAINVAVFVAWRIPLPATWRVLNRYFISVPALPYSASMLGCVFSHQSFSHLAMNMFVLYIFGTTVCEQIGQGSFLALYLSGGVVSSFASVAYNVARSRFHVCSLGASGAIAALLGTYAYLNPENRLTFIFLPFVAIKAKWFVVMMAGVETLGIIRGWKVLDHVAHLSGLGWGTAFAYWLVREVRRRREKLRLRYGR